MRKVFSLAVSLLLTTLFVTCKENNAEFSPGAGDARITGTWQLVERRFAFDTLVNDSIPVIDSANGKPHYVKIKLNRSIDTTLSYPSVPLQTLTFGTDGKLSANGSAMSYYYPIHYFRVDSTIQDGLGVNLYINTNRATIPFRIGLKFQGENLLLLPRCERSCYSKFVRVK